MIKAIKDCNYIVTIEPLYIEKIDSPFFFRAQTQDGTGLHYNTFLGKVDYLIIEEAVADWNQFAAINNITNFTIIINNEEKKVKSV